VALLGIHPPLQRIDRPHRLLTELDRLLGDVAVVQQHVVRRSPPEQHVQLRETEVERVVSIKQGDVNRVRE